MYFKFYLEKPLLSVSKQKAWLSATETDKGVSCIFWRRQTDTYVFTQIITYIYVSYGVARGCPAEMNSEL